MVEKTREEHGFNLSLKVIDLKKGTWDDHENKKVIKEEKYSHLKEPLDEIIEEYPEYGTRKIRTELRASYGYPHGRELIAELMKMWGQNREKQSRNTNKSGYRKALTESDEQADLVRDLEEVDLFEVAYTDFTQLCFGGGGRKAKLMPIIGHASKMVFGWALARRRSTGLAIRSLERALATFKELGVDYEGMTLHQDRDSVYTSKEWVNRLLVKEGLSLSYSMNGARGNAHMESFNGHFKNPVESIFLTAETLEELTEAVCERVEYWNQKRRHAALENRTPMEYLQERR